MNKLKALIKAELNYGFLFILFRIVIKFFFWLNLVEWLKKLFSCKFKDNNCKQIVSNYTIDFFNILKFLFIVPSIFFFHNRTVLYIVIYLGFMNIFTYFYHHCWNVKPCRDINHSRRRFIALGLSFVFNILVFTYLYRFLGANHFEKSSNSFLSLLQFSLANAFAAPSEIGAITLLAYYVVTAQIITTFIYIALLLSQSIPISIGSQDEKK